jgi:hypothetical protein
MKLSNLRYTMLSFLAASCASTLPGQMGGTYQGTATENQAGSTLSQPVTITISEDANFNVTGTWSSGSDGTSGSLSGVDSGGAINPVNVTLASGTCTGTLVGSLSLSGTTLSGGVSGNTNCGQVQYNLSLNSTAVNTYGGYN